MTMQLSENDIDELIHNGKLTITKNIKWKSKSGQLFLEFRVPVENYFRGNSLNLQLVGTKSSLTMNYTFALTLDYTVRIRGLCPYKNHINRNSVREKIDAPHKHKWNDQCQDAFAYKPFDITNVNDIQGTFWEFLKECNIVYEGTFDLPPVTQPEFPLEG